MIIDKALNRFNSELRMHASELDDVLDKMYPMNLTFTHPPFVNTTA